MVVAAQEDGRGVGRIPLKRIPDASAGSQIPFIEDSVELGIVIHTDGWLGYEPLEKKATGTPLLSFVARKNLRPSCCL